MGCIVFNVSNWKLFYSINIMMSQDTIALILVLAALLYTVYAVIKSLRKKESSCTGCPSCDVKRAVQKK